MDEVMECDTASDDEAMADGETMITKDDEKVQSKSEEISLSSEPEFKFEDLDRELILYEPTKVVQKTRGFHCNTRSRPLTTIKFDRRQDI